MMTDTDRLNWLEADSDRLEDVRGRVNNEGVSVRDAMDWFIEQQRTSGHAHQWIDIRNEIIQSGEMCTSCGMLRPDNTHTFTGPLK